MRRPDDVLEPEVERELAALDAALAGEPVDPEFAGLAALAEDVRATRPAISPEFAASLDERVAGFGSRRRSLTALASRRMLLPALGAAASVLLALAVVASFVSDSGEDSGSSPALSAPEGAQRSGEDSGARALRSVEAPAPPEDSLAPGRARRVERQASLVLGTESDRIDEVADGVVRATDEVGGIVVTSSVSSADDGDGGATFALRVPARRLDDAMARLSKLGHVRSRTQNSQDVTGTFVSAQERLDESRAERAGLLRALARADTANETASLRERLRIVRSEISSARGELRRLRVRTDFSSIAVTVEPDRDGSGGAGSGGAWTPGDAVDDAVRILEVFTGVLLVVLAVALPVLLLAAAAGLGGRMVRRRRRESALSAG